MEINLIEFLESKNFSVEEITLFQFRVINKSSNNENIIKKLNAIYKIFNYCNLPELTINKLIINNLKILYKSDHELINLAYSWKQAGLLQEATERHKGLRPDNALKIFLRNIYINSGYSKSKTLSYNSMIMGDEEFKNDYSGTINNVPFETTYENLVILYGKGETFIDKEKYVESVLGTSALQWYLGCLKLERQKASNGKSI